MPFFPEEDRKSCGGDLCIDEELKKGKVKALKFWLLNMTNSFHLNTKAKSCNKIFIYKVKY